MVDGCLTCKVPSCMLAEPLCTSLCPLSGCKYLTSGCTCVYCGADHVVLIGMLTTVLGNGAAIPCGR